MFAHFFIDRPIFATVLSLVIVIVGVVALTQLPIAQYPDVAPPTVSVTASYPGANAQVVADTVATPIEQEVNGVERMMYMSSKCTNDGQMMLEVTFELGTNLDMAQVLVQNRVSAAMAKLPEEVKRLGVTTKKKSPSILLCVNLVSDEGRFDALYLSNFATLQIKDALARIKGVGDVAFLGGRDYSMRVWLDPVKLSARDLTASEAVAAIREQNVQVAAGRLGQPPTPVGQNFQLTLNTLGRLETEEAFEKIVVKTGVQGDNVHLLDVVRDRTSQVRLDPEQLKANGLSAGDVHQSLQARGLQIAPDGQDSSRFTVKSQQLRVEDAPVSKDGKAVLLRDLALKEGGVVDVEKGVELGAKNYDVATYLDGQESITLAVYQLPGSNAVATAEEIRATMKELAGTFPKGIRHEIVYDTTVFIEESVRSVYHTLFEAIALVFVVVLVFLQNWRATLIPMLAVPVSLIGTFAVMALLGFSLNNLSLFGLVLAIGIVVDDAIVVVENVERNLSLGLDPREATRRAMDEVTGPVIAIALVLTAVFVPTAFMAGISGQFYKQFALTIAASTLISAFNSLTLSPALCAILLKGHGHGDALQRVLDGALGWFFRGFNGFFDSAKERYGVSVAWLIRTSVLVLLIYAGFLGLTYWSFQVVPAGFIPEQDKGYLIVNAQLPDGASLERTEAVVKRLADEARRTPGVAHVLSMPGYSVLNGNNISETGGMFVILDDFSKRVGNPMLRGDAIADALSKSYRKVQEAIVVVFGAPPVEGLGSTGGFKLQVQDRKGAGLSALAGAVEGLIDAARAQPRLTGTFSSFTVDQPQIFVDIDREKAKAEGVSLASIFDTLQINLGSAYVNDITLFNRNWQVNVQADARYRLDAKDVGALKVRNQAGQMVPLGTLITLRDTSGPSIVNHYNLYPAAAINGDSAPGTSSGQAIDLMAELSKRKLPDTMGVEWTELTYLQILAEKDLLTKLVFPLAVVFVFLTLAAQYESWILPLAILLIVPLCMLSALTGVRLAGGDNNIFTQIGLVVLIGLAAKNAILIVEFATAQQAEGLGRKEAAIEACRLRLRPILMTSFAFILGVVPLMLAKGAGAEMRQALGVAVFSGMLGVTFFGLAFTPIFYVALRGLTEKHTQK